MGKRKITAASAEESPAAEITTPTPALLAVETPENTITLSTATAEPATLIATPSIELSTPTASSVEPAAVTADAAPIAAAASAPATKSSFLQYAPIAASLALAAALGALAGAAATFSFAAPTPTPAAQSAAVEETIALKNTVAQLGRELATLKAGIDAVGRGTAAQFKTFAERFDRAEKAQVEPAAKLAKIFESLDRLERRATAATPDVTGAVTTVEKHQAKPPALEGWKLVDIYAGRVVLASRAGQLYEIRPGSNLPGVGKVEQIKREDGRIVVVTANGNITAAIEQRRPQPQPYYAPYRYY